ncbi:MAG: hypothetical protein H6718_07865 [Polyangiaceae bacterium]|nr:hypothetical protein [Myxococcales bacterium]MCB9585298.1 hypothetical protein [Polyangiaceae bacterium]MCB9606685.1 hypothetical protein [Polyangiaceae bacterium]
MKSEIELTAADAVKIPISWFPVDQALRASLLLLPALGIRAKLYDYGLKSSLRIRLLTRLMPAVTRLFGYYPGTRFGFGGDEARTLMRQWSTWAQSGKFDTGRMRNPEEQTARFTGPVLSLAFERDDLVSPEALKRAVSPFTGARVERRVLGAAEQGEYLGHAGWAKQPDGVVKVVAEWISRSCDAVRPGRTA